MNMMTELKLRQFAQLAMRGDKAVYFTGDLMYERYKEERHKHRPAEGLGRLAWELYERGLITLVQRRVSRVNRQGNAKSMFEYVAVKL